MIEAHCFPKPPRSFVDIGGSSEFGPAPELKAWAIATFIDENSPLYNEDHEHLADAKFLFVWSRASIKSKGARVIGTASTGKQRGGMGAKEFLESFYQDWFESEDPEENEGLPDFIITIDANYVEEASPLAICALIEHELYHCDVRRDEDGEPLYIRAQVTYKMRGHDIEEFFGVARRYGAATVQLMQLKNILGRSPEVDESWAREHVCGCGARV